MPISHDPVWLEKLHDVFVEAFRSNDLKALGACYTDLAVLLPPGRAIVSGRDAIVEFWKGAEQIQDLTFEATDTRMVLGNTVFREVGNLLITRRGQGRETLNVAAKYLAIWVQMEGAWKLDSTMWNRIGDGRVRHRDGGGRGRQGGMGGGRGGAGRGRPGNGRRGGEDQGAG